MKHIINVSSRLPLAKSDNQIHKFSNTISTVMDSIMHEHDIWWIGWADVNLEEYIERDKLSNELKEKYKYLPIFLEDEEVENYFNGFSNSSLWPLLHYISTFSNYENNWYKSYLNVNKKFAGKVIEHARDDDLIWIHDYHLMLVPAFIKELRPDLKVGFFFHTPFPSYELFRCHPRREELLKGVLEADLIGFQTFGFLRHFRSTVLRVLGIESKVNSIIYSGHNTQIGVYPVGIDTKMIDNVKTGESYKEIFMTDKKNFKDKNIILSIDHLDSSKGVLQKLMAIENFLRDYPEKRENVVFIIVAIPSREETGEYEHLTHDVDHAIGRINGQYSSLTNVPILFLNKRIPFKEALALYALADVALITPLVDGMNLMAKEYIYAKESGEGVLILSEFAGASQELFNAIMVNPYNIDQVEDAIVQALEMERAEKKSMMKSMLDRIKSNDALYWANSFIGDLDKLDSTNITERNIKILDESVAKQFKNKSIKKALFLDYDGTLREFVNIPSKAVPGEELIDIFNKLNERSDIDVYIISGRNKGFLEKHFGHYNFTLIGEHGYFLKEPNSKWKTLVGEIDMSWKQEIADILKLYSLSTPGTEIEEKNSALVWHYRRADPEFGTWKANELIGELTEVISNLPVEIHHGRKIVEVSSQYVNKGLAMARFLNEKKYELVLCAGDDKTDETMFYFEDIPLISVKIGDGETKAGYRISTPQQFRKFLTKIL